MRVVNRTRGTVVASHVRIADGVWTRFRGFLGRPEPEPDEGMLLAPCNAVHTFGMAYPLDVLFLSSGGTVVEAVRGLAPWRRTRRVKDARYVLEVRAGTIEATRTEPGDELAWMPPRVASHSGRPPRENVDTGEAQAAAPSRRS